MIIRSYHRVAPCPTRRIAWRKGRACRWILQPPSPTTHSCRMAREGEGCLGLQSTMPFLHLIVHNSSPQKDLRNTRDRLLALHIANSQYFSSPSSSCTPPQLLAFQEPVPPPIQIHILNHYSHQGFYRQYDLPIGPLLRRYGCNACGWHD